MSDRYQFHFKPRFLEIDGVRLHYIDEGIGTPVLLVHGNPTSCYLYRKMIPPLISAGYRCVAPDLMGFGLSDKPEDEAAYTFGRHVSHVTALIEHLGLEALVTVGQEWGGPISLRYAIDHRHNIKALVLLSTFVRRADSTGIFGLLMAKPWSSFLIRRFDLFRKAAFSVGFARPVYPQAKADYFAHHPVAAQRAGIAAFPKMIPDSISHPNDAAINQIGDALTKWNIPLLVAFADRDKAFSVDEGQRIAEAAPDGQFRLIENAGHYLQEDAGEEIAMHIVSFLDRALKPKH